MEGNSKIFTPVPDPTTLTTQNLQREIHIAREVIETRLVGLEKEVEAKQTNIEKIPELIKNAVAHLKELHEEKFGSIQTQFNERDTRTEQTSHDSKVAVDAALQAAKEAVGEQNKSFSQAIQKSETITSKQIEQIGILIANMQKAFDDKIDDMKERIISIEERITSIESEKRGRSDVWGYVGVIIGILIGLAGIMWKR